MADPINFRRQGIVTIPSHLGFDADTGAIEKTMQQRLTVLYGIEPSAVGAEDPFVTWIGHDANELGKCPLAVRIDTEKLTKEQVVAMLRELADGIEADGLQVNVHESERNGFAIMDRGPERRSEPGTSWAIPSNR